MQPSTFEISQRPSRGPIVSVIRRAARRLLFRDLPAFVILLERDAERSAHVREHVAAVVPRCTIVPATDFHDRDIDSYLAREGIRLDRTNYADMTPAKLACTVSHIRVWRMIAERRLPAAIVFEDDLVIGSGFRSFVSRLRRELPDDFDLVHLCVTIDRQAWADLSATADRAHVDFAPKWGRSAYMVSAGGVRKLLAGFASVTRHGDMQIAEMARRGALSVRSASEEHVVNLGQADANYRGERFPSNIWNPARTVASHS